MSRSKDKKTYLKYELVIDTIKKNSSPDHPLIQYDLNEIIGNYEYINNDDEKTTFDFNDNRTIKRYIKEYNEYYNNLEENENERIEIRKYRCHKDGELYRDEEGNYIETGTSNDISGYVYMNNGLSITNLKTIETFIHSSNFFDDKTKQDFTRKIKDMYDVNRLFKAESKSRNYYDHDIDLSKDRGIESISEQDLSRIYDALIKHKKISFKYEKPAFNNSYTKIHERISPIDTCFKNNFYYLIVQNLDKEHVDEPYFFRIDYIKDVEILDESINIKENDLDSIKNIMNNITEMYYNYDDERNKKWLTIEFDESNYPNVLDKFGNTSRNRKNKSEYNLANIRQMTDSKGNKVEGKLRADLLIIPNHSFYSWLVEFNGGPIQISKTKSPDERKKMQSFLLDYFFDEEEKSNIKENIIKEYLESNEFKKIYTKREE